MSEFNLCSECLGDNDKIRMVRQENGDECKLCTRPYTVFRWNSGGKGANQLNKTIICKSCATARNCCQSCMLDIFYRIPLHLRDAALKMAGISNQYESGEQSKNREVKAIMAEKTEAKQKKQAEDGEEDCGEKAKEILGQLAEKLGKTSKSVSSSRAPTVKNSGGAKEFNKIVSKLPFGGLLNAPEDITCKSFFIFGFDPTIPQYTISEYFGKYGQLAATKIVHQARCGFVTFATRSVAEKCALSIQQDRLNGKNPNIAGLVILDSVFPLRVTWGHPKPLGASNDDYGKLALVTTKVMKQLADKSKNSGKKSSLGKSSPAPKQSTYKAAGDVEL